jgi:hypothetical protein
MQGHPNSCRTWQNRYKTLYQVHNTADINLRTCINMFLNLHCIICSPPIRWCDYQIWAYRYWLQSTRLVHSMAIASYTDNWLMISKSTYTCVLDCNFMCPV